MDQVISGMVVLWVHVASTPDILILSTIPGTLWQRCWSWLPRPFFPWLANQCAQTKTQNPHEQSSGSSLLNPLAPLLLIVTAPQVRLVSRRLSAAAKHRAALLQRHEDSAHSGKVGNRDAMLMLR